MSDPPVIIGLDDAELDAVLTRVLKNAEEMAGVVDDVDRKAEETREDVRLLDKEAGETLHRIASIGRRTAASVTAIVRASGDVVGEIYAVSIEAGLLTVELLAGIATAEATTVAGIASASIKITMIGVMVAQINELRQGDAESAKQIQLAYAIISPWSYG